MTKEQWQEIKDKQPKAYLKFMLFHYGCPDDWTIDNFEKIAVKFHICFCDILKFFDSVGIDLLSMLYQLKCDAEFFKTEYIQDAAAIKAFEILNIMIEKGEIK